ncbi:MAG: type II toxin-antitoxin system Phd/YefM family antitoxin [Niameybacter sp.]|uniref:type II toxin-antitoxin system Phd/YefM family antitoxin n=1 Tax=Niameybacter sp. TaxID=2033640 RepID=UPI002FCC3F61
MPAIRPISDLRNNANDISEFCHINKEPIFITKNGIGDMVVMGMETYEKMQAQLELYMKLGEAELDIANGDEGEEFLDVAKQLRGKLNGAL